jgi:hypothetical protein
MTSLRITLLKHEPTNGWNTQVPFHAFYELVLQQAFDGAGQKVSA